MEFETLDEGFVTTQPSSGSTAAVCGPRVALARNGSIVCNYQTQTALGLNDFKPTVSRSLDDGRTWRYQGLMWPHLAMKYSIFGSVSRGLDGELLFFGNRTPIDEPGESFWSDVTQGIKQNELVWSVSRDDGRVWAEPEPFPMPIPGAAESPGAMCATRDGGWICCYAPYNSFDTKVIVDRKQIVFMRSDDRGRSWSSGSMMRFDEVDSGGAEAWVVELSDGRLLGTCWHVDLNDDAEYENTYALSSDGGRSWSPTLSTGIRGQSTGLAALPDGRAVFVYNQRKHGEPGVRLAVCNPTESGFGVEHEQLVWTAQVRTQTKTSGDHGDWQDFAFGEPCVVQAEDGTLVVVFWCLQPEVRGIGFVRLGIRD